MVPSPLGGAVGSALDCNCGQVKLYIWSPVHHRRIVPIDMGGSIQPTKRSYRCVSTIVRNRLGQLEGRDLLTRLSEIVDNKFDTGPCRATISIVTGALEIALEQFQLTTRASPRPCHSNTSLESILIHAVLWSEIEGHSNEESTAGDDGLGAHVVSK